MIYKDIVFLTSSPNKSVYVKSVLIVDEINKIKIYWKVLLNLLYIFVTIFIFPDNRYKTSSCSVVGSVLVMTSSLHTNCELPLILIICLCSSCSSQTPA